MRSERKVSAALWALKLELQLVRKLDDHNQQLNSAPLAAGAPLSNSNQRHLISEALISRAFACYENYIERVFLLFTQNRPGFSGRKYGSCVNPKNYIHARQLVKSDMRFLEWNNPDVILSRCEIYLCQDHPLHLAVSSNMQHLRSIRKLRNAIAHRSVEAKAQFHSVVQQELGFLPPRRPTPGAFLNFSDRFKTSQHYLKSYFDVLERVATIASG